MTTDLSGRHCGECKTLVVEGEDGLHWPTAEQPCIAVPSASGHYLGVMLTRYDVGSSLRWD